MLSEKPRFNIIQKGMKKTKLVILKYKLYTIKLRELQQYKDSTQHILKDALRVTSVQLDTKYRSMKGNCLIEGNI